MGFNSVFKELIVFGEIVPQKKLFFRGKCCQAVRRAEEVQTLHQRYANLRHTFIAYIV